MKLRNVVFPQPDGAGGPLQPQLWDIGLVDGVVESAEPSEMHADGEENGTVSHLLLPPLCHPHLHLDKALLLTSSGCCGDGSDAEDDKVNYSDLLPQSGSFAEALQTTAVAKTRFTAPDLRRRGLQLLATSCAQGVTSARVFVEVDAEAAGQGTVAVTVARELQLLFEKSSRMALQVCAFAQEVLFTGTAGPANRAAMEAVLAANRTEGKEEGSRSTISVLGVTPYVEQSREKALQNIDWAVTTALEYGLHLDLHLDYNLKAYSGSSSSSTDADSKPLIFALLDTLIRHRWTERAVSGDPAGVKKKARPKTVVVGHATQLTCLPRPQLTRLATVIREHQLPVSFVGLPTSDLYMMGRQQQSGIAASLGETTLSAPRGTLPVPALIRDFGLNACLGVNNVGNAFTPHGTGDPLHLACWGVGLYHAGTGPDAQLLYGSVSWRARAAIGMDDDDEEAVDWEKPLGNPKEHLVGKRIGRLLAVANKRNIQLPQALQLPSAKADLGMEIDAILSRIPARPRLAFRDVVWDPPDISLRKVV
ncbi:hypothetical protein SCUCBS95973_003764 [Sporothrix curviconia]|uniref:Zinc metallopeptidase n=1 Tax=Sporothrix curviconia TaxID=1260050 RepID=A0ABP0BJD3_9PEZI